MTANRLPQPIQPLVLDDRGTLRFQANAIVQALLDAGPLDMNTIATMPFSQADREQFAQLIGYSFGGASELSYVRSEVLDAAKAAHDNPQDPAAQASLLRQQVQDLRDALRAPMAALFDVHPDNLG